MRELVRGYAAAAFESAERNDRLSAVVSDLGSFVRVVESSIELRLALTDGSVDAHTRRDIVVDLVSGKTAPEATNLLSYAVRFERPGELSATLVGLVSYGEQTAQASSESELAVLSPQSAPMATRERVRGYAERALQELGAMSEIDEVEDELFRFARILDDNVNLRRTLADLNNSYAGRAAIVTDLLGGHVQDATLRIVKYVLRAGRTCDLVGMFERLVELAAAERGRRVGEVRSAIDLDEHERDRVAQALGRLVERPVEVRVIHDPRVIGGVLISIGDLVIDGTVRIRFERLRDLLA